MIRPFALGIRVVSKFYEPYPWAMVGPAVMFLSPWRPLSCCEDRR